MGLRFEQDAAKAAANFKKHGVSFEEAATIFGDPLSITVDDPDRSTDEMRFATIGSSLRSRILACVHTEREGALR